MTIKGVLCGGAAIALTALSACGGGGGSHHGGPKPKHSKTPASPSGPVGILASIPGKQYGSFFKVKPGDLVSFRITVPAGPGSPSSRAALDFPEGTAHRLTATATIRKSVSQVVLQSASGQPVTLVGLRYACSLPPGPTFCPGRGIATKGDRATVRFRTTAAQPIVMSATVGPLPGRAATPPPPPAPSLVVPPYRLTTSLVVIPRPPKPGQAKPKPKPAKTGTSLSASPGQTAEVRVTPSGSTVGAPQPVTIDFDQGPSSKITFSVTSNGSSSKADLTGSDGKTISLVLPRYGCTLPPAPTFCPARNVKAGSRHYSVTFLATPQTPIALSATVQ